MNIKELAEFLANQDHYIDIAKNSLEDGEIFYIGMSKPAWLAVLDSIKDGQEARKNASLNSLEEEDFSKVADILCRELILHSAYEHIFKSIEKQAE